MPHDPMPHAHRRRRRLLALAAVSALGAALVPVIFTGANPAIATTPCVPDGFTANASAGLLNLDLLDVSPLGLLPSPIAHVMIGHATADMAHAQAQHATGTADYLSAALAGINVPAGLLSTHARQDAPPAHMTPDAHSLVAVNSGLLNLGIGNVKAAAGQTGAHSCGLASGDASIADATVLPGLRGHSLLSLPHNLNGTAGTGLISTPGGLASEATAAAGLADLDLFGGTAAEIGVKVITEPTLRGIATGSTATSLVTYTSPVLDVRLPGGVHATIDGVHTTLDLVTDANAGAVSGLLSTLHLPITQDLPVLSKLAKKTQIELRLTIGDMTKHVGPTSVSGEAATLRLQLLLAPHGTRGGMWKHAATGSVTLLDLGIGELSVAATAPHAAPSPCASSGGYGQSSCPAPTPCTSHGGYGHDTAPCPSASPSPHPSPSTHSSVPVTGRSGPPTTVEATNTTPTSLPLTGSKTTWFLGAGVLLLIVGRLLLVVTRRRMSE